MRIKRVSLLFTLLLVAVTTSSVQGGSYYTPFITSITYQNVSTTTTTADFKFYNPSGTLVKTISRTVAGGAGGSLAVGNAALGLPARFAGSVVMSANQKIVATLVQSPESIKVKNRLLTNSVSFGAQKLRFPTITKNLYTSETTSDIAIQNMSTGNIDIRITFYDVTNPTSPVLVHTESNVPVNAARHFRMASEDARDLLVPLSAGTFNGSAIVEAFVAGTTTPTIIAGSAIELANTDPEVGNSYSDPSQRYFAVAYEAIRSGATTLYMATALCNSGPTNNTTNTTYAVQNVDTAAANVTVTYSDGQQDTQTIQPGAKYSFGACAVHTSVFNGSAKVVSTNGKLLAAIGKAWKPNDPNFVTAFEGLSQGGTKLALPYVRYTNDTNYNSGSRQRTFIAIQNIGTSTVTNVQVKYLDTLGGVTGTHTIASIGANQKATSYATLASGDAAKLQEFGYPESNLGGSYGGSVIIETSSGQLIALARVSSVDTNTNKEVAEDYMATVLP